MIQRKKETSTTKNKDNVETWKVGDSSPARADQYVAKSMLFYWRNHKNGI